MENRKTYTYCGGSVFPLFLMPAGKGDIYEGFKIIKA